MFICRGKTLPDLGFLRRALALAKMAPWGLRKLSRPPPYPLLHFLLTCAFCPENMGTVSCPLLPRSHCTPSLPCAALFWLPSQLPLGFYLRSALLRQNKIQTLRERAVETRAMEHSGCGVSGEGVLYR